MLTTTVDNYPGFPDGIQGPDLIANMRKQAERFGAQFVGKNVDKINFSVKPFEIFTGSDKYVGSTVIIATGAQTKWLDAPGVKELIGRGVSSCAPCDAAFFKDKKVVVVGGGDSAMEEALVLTKYATEVMIVHRRDAFRASAVMQQKVLNHPKIKVIWNTEVKEVKGSQKVESIKLINNQENKESEMAIDGIFIAIGHKPDSAIFQGTIDLDDKGFVILKDGTKTNVDGVFVAGDVHDHRYKQAITAAGFGCMAAMDVLKYVDEVR